MSAASPPVLFGRDLHKTFRRDTGEVVQALDGVSLEAQHGTLVALVGPDGAGKTTLLRLVAGLLPPDAGELKVLDVDVAADPQQVQERISYMPQKFGLYEDLSVQDNLDLYADMHGVTAAERRQRYPRLLDMTALGPFTDRLAGRLSGGMKQKLGLACTLVRAPELLLLDEPTVGVDPQSREKILRTIRNLAGAGATVIYSTHYMDEVERICDRVLLIDRGRLVAAGTVAEVVALAGEHPRIEITFEREPPPNWCARPLLSVNSVAGAERNKVELKLDNLAQVSEVLEQARVAGGRVLEFSVHSPNLSDAFMTLTGRALRDAEPA
jgi:ABC-2 type transport system ATP-binding protein